MDRLYGDSVSLGQVIDALGAGGTGVLLLLVGAVTLVPGIAPVFGFVLGAVALGLVTGRDAIQLPEFLRTKRIERARLDDGLRKLFPRLDWLESHLPRAREGALSMVTIRLAGAAALVNAVLVVLPIPFGNTAPAVASLILALGLIASNARTVLAGAGATVAALAIDAAFVAIAWEAVLGLFRLI
jgi:hypothetical protein